MCSAGSNPTPSPPIGCSPPRPDSRYNFAPPRLSRVGRRVRRLTVGCASWHSYSEVREIEVFLIFLELGFDVCARVSAFEERLDSGVGQDLLKCGAIFGNELNEGVLAVIAQHERKAENSGVCPRGGCRFEIRGQGRVHGTNRI